MRVAVTQCRFAARLIVLFAAVTLMGLVELAAIARPAAASQMPYTAIQPNTITPSSGPVQSPDSLNYSGVISFYFPAVAVAVNSYSCAGIPGATYNTIVPTPPPTDRPADQHADLNLGLRSYATTSAELGLLNYGGSTDPGAPQLYSLFQDNRTPTFRTDYKVYDWNWDCNCRGSLLSDWPVTLAGLSVTPGEIIRVPGGGYDLGWMPSGYEVMVLYATSSRITLKYTREDNVVYGYTIHLENICVDPALVNLYNQMNSSGRSRLPALAAGQSFGRALTNELGVAIRDAGTFMDPRSCKDWWRNQC